MGLSMFEILRQRQMLQKVLAQKPTRPLNISIGHHSDTQAFSISPIAVPNGVVEAIRVQDIARGSWFEYNRATGWSGAPEVTVGANLYIAAYATNLGGDGELRILIKNDQAMALADKRQNVATGASFGAETGTINMPNRTYGIIVSVNP